MVPLKPLQRKTAMVPHKPLPSMMVMEGPKPHPHLMEDQFQCHCLYESSPGPLSSHKDLHPNKRPQDPIDHLHHPRGLHTDLHHHPGGHHHHRSHLTSHLQRHLNLSTSQRHPNHHHPSTNPNPGHHQGDHPHHPQRSSAPPSLHTSH